MDKKLQDLAWSVLPKEFKEEVKRSYQDITGDYPYVNGFENALEFVFGFHNLTSDAEGGEMLCVPRKKVQEIFRRNSKRIGECCPTCDNDEILKCDSRCGLLLNLFDSKCLPDENFSNVGKLEENGEVQRKYKYKVGQKVILHFHGGELSTITDSFDDGGVWLKYKVKALPNHVWNENELEPYDESKPAEPKFKVGDKVEFKNCCSFEVTAVEWSEDYKEYKYRLAGWKPFFRESKLERYIEPQEESKPVTDCNDVDRLIKDDFRDMRRLNIAKDFAAVLLGRLNYDPFTAQINCCCSNGEVVNPYSNIAGIALSVADALIVECEKGDATSTTPLPAKPKEKKQ